MYTRTNTIIFLIVVLAILIPLALRAIKRDELRRKGR